MQPRLRFLFALRCEMRCFALGGASSFPFLLKRFRRSRRQPLFCITLLPAATSNTSDTASTDNTYYVL